MSNPSRRIHFSLDLARTACGAGKRLLDKSGRRTVTASFLAAEVNCPACRRTLKPSLSTFARFDPDDATVVEILGDYEPGHPDTDDLIRRETRDGLRVIALNVAAEVGDVVKVDDDGCAVAVFPTPARLDAGPVTLSDCVAGGLDVDVSVDDHGGAVTLVQGQDGCFWSWGSPDHWVDGKLLAYIRTRPDAEDVLTELAAVAGSQADHWFDNRE